MQRGVGIQAAQNLGQKLNDVTLVFQRGFRINRGYRLFIFIIEVITADNRFRLVKKAAFVNHLFALGMGIKGRPGNFLQNQRDCDNHKDDEENKEKDGFAAIFGNKGFNNRFQQAHQQIGHCQTKKNNCNQLNQSPDHRIGRRFVIFGLFIFDIIFPAIAGGKLFGTPLVALFTAKAADIFDAFLISIVLNVKNFADNFDGNPVVFFKFLSQIDCLLTLIAGKLVNQFPAVAAVGINLKMYYFYHISHSVKHKKNLH